MQHPSPLLHCYPKQTQILIYFNRAPYPLALNVIPFWKYIIFRRVTDLAANFTVRFTGTGYKVIEPLDTSIQLMGMLSSSPVKLIGMEANDGKHVNLITKIQRFRVSLLAKAFSCRNVHVHQAYIYSYVENQQQNEKSSSLLANSIGGT